MDKIIQDKINENQNEFNEAAKEMLLKQQEQIVILTKLNQLLEKRFSVIEELVKGLANIKG